MYNYLKGTVTEISPNDITVDIIGIGYKVFTPNPYEFKLDQENKVYIYHHVREDINALYGFKTKDAKELFMKLLSVKGIGPKSAMAILATGNVNDVVGAIELGNAKFLSKFPGIGPKASQQIILDLKGKLSFDEPGFTKSNSITEVEQALKSLGYKASEIKKAITKLDGTRTTEQLLRDALGAMLK
jgi:Holliday junction DNA helicase RuvA